MSKTMAFFLMLLLVMFESGPIYSQTSSDQIPPPPPPDSPNTFRGPPPGIELTVAPTSSRVKSNATDQSPSPLTPIEKEYLAEKLMAPAEQAQHFSTSKNPTANLLLKEAGFTSKSKIQIYKSFLSLDDQDGYPALDLYYFIFCTQDKNPKVLKIKVVLFNHQEQIANLLAYAPMMVYLHGDANGAEVQNYLCAEAYSGKMEDAYPVLHNKASAYLFSYDERIMKGNPPREVSFKDIFKLILKGLDDVSGKGKAQMLVDEGGRFHLNSFQRIYPK